jgi:hypothetical protein
MPIYKVKLKSRQEIAAGTMAFHFEKPEGFAYKAGQFGDFTLADPPETDAEGNTRGFSLTSAPYESDLMVATRMRDTAFKRVLKTMKLGSELALDAPYGSFILPDDARVPAVFLSGGHRRHAHQEHRPPGNSRQTPPQDLPLRLESKAGGRGVPGRTNGRTEGKSELHPRRHDDGDGEIRPGLARGDRVCYQSYAREVHH